MSVRYPSDVSREQFAIILPILESSKHRTKPRTIDLYDIFCGICYVLKSGCQWRMLPKEYPKWQHCYFYFSQWKCKRVNADGEASDSILEECLKKISWRGETKQWSERNHQFSHY